MSILSATQKKYRTSHGYTPDGQSPPDRAHLMVPSDIIARAVQSP